MNGLQIDEKLKEREVIARDDASSVSTCEGWRKRQEERKSALGKERPAEQPFAEEEGFDDVDHPSHYTSHPAGIECIDVVEHMTFCAGNAVKYLWRAGLKTKDPIQDLRKSEWYVRREIQRLSRLAEESSEVEGGR